MLGNLNLAVALRSSVLHHRKHCMHVCQGLVLNKAVSSQIYKKYDWQRTSVELAICTAH